MQIKTGTDLIWDIDKYDVILIGTSVFGKLDNGFQSKMRFRFPIIEEVNDRLPYGDLRRIGTRHTFYDLKPIVSLMFMTRYPTSIKEYIDYDGFENCLSTANAEFKGMKVASTFLGTSKYDGNADKDKCLDIIKRTLADVDYTMYDYEQLDRKKEIQVRKRYISSFRETDPEKYKTLKNQLNNILRQLYLSK